VVTVDLLYGSFNGLTHSINLDNLLIFNLLNWSPITDDLLFTFSSGTVADTHCEYLCIWSRGLFLNSVNYFGFGLRYVTVLLKILKHSVLRFEKSLFSFVVIAEFTG
jgi:hypothetical protein